MGVPLINTIYALAEIKGSFGRVEAMARLRAEQEDVSTDLEEVPDSLRSTERFAPRDTIATKENPHE